MAALVEIVRESDIRRYASGDSDPELDAMVRSVLRNDERAQALYVKELKILQTRKDRKMALEQNPVEARQGTTTRGGVRRVLITSLALAVIGLAAVIRYSGT